VSRPLSRETNLYLFDCWPCCFAVGTEIVLDIASKVARCRPGQCRLRVPGRPAGASSFASGGLWSAQSTLGSVALPSNDVTPT
jgi:hypothetical protein